jgi:hypothetical protein
MGWWIGGVVEWWERRRGHREGRLTESRVRIGFTERNFFVRTVSKYGIATELQPKEADESTNGCECGEVESTSRRPFAHSGEGMRAEKLVNKFFKFLFPQATTREAKGSENRDKEFWARATREKTGRIRGTQTKANEYEH